MAFFIAIVPLIVSNSFGQTQEVDQSPQTTLSGDLLKSPLAQDILEKIEQTKKKITEMQQKEMERLEAQKELEQIREKAKISLQNDLKEWEKLWETFSFDYMFERQGGIFWGQYDFTYSKILAGRAALEQVLSEGGNAEQARSAYVDAAKIKRSELIEINALLNVRYNLAYYNQQILFDSDGQFHDIVSGDQLRKYYQDFRTNPSYLNANPKDETSWEETSRDSNTYCGDLQILVYRFNANDYVCVTEQTSEMWVRHGIGKTMSENLSLNTDLLSVEKLREDRLEEKIKNINNKINSMNKFYDEKLDNVEKKYDLVLLDLRTQEREEEQKIVVESKNTSTSLETLNQRIEEVRQRYELLEDIRLQEKTRTFKILDSNHEQEMKNFVKNFESIPDVKIIWESDESGYKAIEV